MDFDRLVDELVQRHGRTYRITRVSANTHPQVRGVVDLNLRLEEVQAPTMVDITKDRRTVWVNTELGCVARFCPISGEVLKFENGSTKVMYELPSTTRADWDNWVAKVKEVHNVDVWNNYMPNWVGTKDT